MNFEADIIRFFQANMTVSWITVFQIITLFGSYLGLVIAFLIIFVKDRKLSVTLLITFAVASIINYVLKIVIKRDRPFEIFEDIKNFGNEDGYSMPSGHSMCGAIFATFLIYYLLKNVKNVWLRISGTVAISLVPMTIALSRMALGVHYFTDVLVGLIEGVAFSIIGILLLQLYIRKKR